MGQNNGGAYVQGLSAFRYKVEFSANPYPRDTEEFIFWRSGWVEAFNSDYVLPKPAVAHNHRVRG